MNITKTSWSWAARRRPSSARTPITNLAVKSIVASRVIFSGQVCNCAERAYVQESVADEFLAKIGPRPWPR